MINEPVTLADKLTPEEIGNQLVGKFPDTVQVVKTAPRRLYLTVNRSSIFEVGAHMKDELGFDHTSCVSGVDRCDRYQVVYHITSYSNHTTAEVVVDLPHENPEVDSVTPLWGGANWHEREAFDMFGIVFKGHPDPRRVLLPDDYEFFPMRKKCDGGKE